MTVVEKKITVFEHQRLKLGNIVNGVKFKLKHLEALEHHYGNGEKNYFRLINKGIQFNQFVGVIKVGELTIEVLPKTDQDLIELNDQESVANNWRNVLVGMLKAVGAFKVQAPSSTSLNTKSNFILDLYFELFLNEVEYLLHMGLVRQYYKIEKQSNALKGTLLFREQISKNLVHKERFYVRHNQYLFEHPLNRVLFKTLKLLKSINTNSSLQNRIESLLLHFPQLSEIKVTDGTFEKIKYTRKTTPYKNAIEISRLLLLNYHPDITAGVNNVLAIMFDMNVLWERFVYVSLKKYCLQNQIISAQTHKLFWKSENGIKSKIKPDIVIHEKSSLSSSNHKTFVLDTKWKNFTTKGPSPGDLRQMYAYHKYFDAQKVALIYPGSSAPNNGSFVNEINEPKTEKQCSLLFIPLKQNINNWQRNINSSINTWLNELG